MIKAVIIEDEPHASELLIQSLTEISDEIKIEAVLTTIDESIRYLSVHKNTDLIFSDVQLSDGLAFDIFQSVGINAPVIFITAYDQFITAAFDNNGIDYIIKPFTKEDLIKSLNKYNNFKDHFIFNNELFNNLLVYINKKKKTRIIVKKGIDNVALLFDKIVLFFTENKLVYAVDPEGRKYQVDKNLSTLEHALDKSQFLRVNRQYIINVNFIKGFKTYQRVKLKVELLVNNQNFDIIISQEMAPEFRRWIGQL